MDVLELTQWSDAAVRQEGSHVEYENENWKKSYPIETTLFDSVACICTAVSLLNFHFNDKE